MHIRNSILLAVIFSFLGLCWAVVDSQAVPSFARKYQTSCQTCHVAYPKLNPFGEAYRVNGFEWPTGIDDEEANTKEEPVELGAEAYKRVFPDAVWPGAIPGLPPISFRARTGGTWTDDEVEGTLTSFVPPTLQVMMAGTLGQGVGFFVGVHLFEEGSIENASLDRLYIRLNNMFSGSTSNRLLSLKIGQFLPEIVPFATNHRGLTLTPFAFTTYSPAQGLVDTHVHGGGADHQHKPGPYRPLQFDPNEPPLVAPAFQLEGFRLGLEASGIVKSRFRYVLGLVDSDLTGESPNDADGYARLSYKFGGLALDGTGTASDSNKNWAERSITIGGFGYLGSIPNEETGDPEDLDFNRIGGDVNIYFDNLNLFGGYQFGQDDWIFAAGDLGEVDYDVWFAQANYVFFPWFLGILRYEQASVEDVDPERRLVANTTFLYRANIRFQIESRFDPDVFKFNNLGLGLDFAF